MAYFSKLPHHLASSFLAPIGVLVASGLLLPASVNAQIAAQASKPQPSAPIQAINTGQTRYGTGLGRLLTSERERSKIDDLRFKAVNPIVAAKVEMADEGPQLLRIDGVSHRPDRPAGQRTSVWISGRVYAENELPYGLSIVRNAKGEVIGLNSVVSKGKTEFAKIGDDITRPQTAAEAKTIELAATQPKKPVEQP